MAKKKKEEKPSIEEMILDRETFKEAIQTLDNWVNLSLIQKIHMEYIISKHQLERENFINELRTYLLSQCKSHQKSGLEPYKVILIKHFGLEHKSCSCSPASIKFLINSFKGG